MPKRRLLVIANPISGRGRAVKMMPRILEAASLAGVEAVPGLTDRAGHGRELAADAAKSGFDAVAACGGDGTVNEVVNGLGPHGLPLLVVPFGTGNVLAKEIGAERDPRVITETLAEWHTLRRDLGRMDSGRLFTCFVGAGFDGECTRALKELRRGSIRMSNYGPIIWNAIRAADYSGIRVSVDGRTCEPSSYALAALTWAYGGPIELVSHARPDDGLLDVLTTTRRITPLNLLHILSLAFRKAMGQAPRTSFSRGCRISVEPPEKSDRPIPIQVDGDFGGYLPFEAEILPGALTCLHPPR